jgi:hypothetical protein
MGRRSNEQICIDLRRERARLYARRTKIIDRLSNPKYTGQKRIDDDNNYKQINKRVDEIRENIFRCGKKYSRLKKEKRKLQRHNTYLLKKVRAGNLTSKEKNRLYREMRDTVSAIKDVEKSMLLPIGYTKGNTTGIQAIGGGKFKGDDVIWVMKSMVKTWIDSGRFEYLVLDGQLIDLSNILVALVEIERTEQDVMAMQTINPSPHFYYYGDIDSGFLVINARSYLPSMYTP